MRYLDVLADDVYLMYVTNFSDNGGTISLTWDLGAGASFDCLTPPMAAFTASAGTITPGGSVNFIDQSQVFPYAWEWSFPVAALLRARNAIPGTYSIPNPAATTWASPFTMRPGPMPSPSPVRSLWTSTRPWAHPWRKGSTSRSWMGASWCAMVMVLRSPPSCSTCRAGRSDRHKEQGTSS